MRRHPAVTHDAADNLGAARDEETLDPADWQEFARIAHDALDQALGFVQGVRDRPVWQQVPDEVKAAIDEPMPLQPHGAAKAVEDISKLILPHATGNIHPRFFGWVHGSGTAGGIIAEMLSAAMNANVGGRDHGAVYVERQVIEWCRQLFGFPAGTSGLLVSGTSMATLIALTVARNAQADIRRHGLGCAGAPLTAYASSQAHSSAGKALEMLGVGSEALHKIAVDDRLQMDPAALHDAIKADRAKGMKPFCVVATAGTVNTGAIDPLGAIADICAQEGVWLHVDGAFGALTVLADELRPLVAGIERADSLAFDFHKWMHVPYDAGCVLIRDGAAHKAAFGSRPDYLAGTERGLAAGDPWFCEYGPELSRGFRALKVWFTLKEHGTARLGEQVAKNCAQARYLAGRVQGSRWLELLAPVSLNIVCFRFAAPRLSRSELDKANADIVVELQERGIAAPSTTRLDGNLAIRVNITNHRTCRADLDLLVDAIIELGTDKLFSGALPCRTGADDGDSSPDARTAATQPDTTQPVATQPVATQPVTALVSLDGTAKQLDLSAARLRKCLERPELRLLAADVELWIDDSLDQPFRVEGSSRVMLAPQCFQTPAGAMVLIRHALELSLWQRLATRSGGLAFESSLALLACHGAGSYLASLTEAERAAAARGIPPWLLSAYQDLAGGNATAGGRGARAPGAWPQLAAVLGPGDGLLTGLLQLQGERGDELRSAQASPDIKAETCNLFARYSALAVPAEQLLVSGGDHRIQIDARSARNSYGSSPRPLVAELSFSSSTASSVSASQYKAVEALRQELIASAIGADTPPAFNTALEAVRRQILTLTGADKVRGAEAILTASGTDAELAALYLALRERDGKLTNIVIAPDETGSGVTKAAAGRHFSSQTALGASVVSGEPISAFAQEAVRVETVAVRDGGGNARDLAALDREVEALVENAIAAGSRCLLHILDAAKTGLGAPSLELVDTLKARHGDRLDVVVDACQMRLGVEAMQAYLLRGFMLQITGSKFFTGPPFCGALVVPPAILERAAAGRGVPAGLKDYSAKSEWPASMAASCDALPDAQNLGLLARWTAALAEIRAYQEVPRERAGDILSRFATETAAMIKARDEVALVETACYDRAALGIDDSWAGLTTIVAFTLHRIAQDGRRRALSLEEAKCVHRWLNHDLADSLPAGLKDAERRIAATACLIGQPVNIGAREGDAIGALRICSSARIVSRVHRAQVGAASATSGGGLAEVMDEVRTCLDKVSLILRHFDRLHDGAAAD